MLHFDKIRMKSLALILEHSYEYVDCGAGAKHNQNNNKQSSSEYIEFEELTTRLHLQLKLKHDESGHILKFETEH